MPWGLYGLGLKGGMGTIGYMAISHMAIGYFLLASGYWIWLLAMDIGYWLWVWLLTIWIGIGLAF